MNTKNTPPMNLPSLVKKKLRPVLAASLIALLSACGGNGDNFPDAQNGEYDGGWDARYNFLADTCVIATEVTGVLDVHDISQSGTSVELFSNLGFGEPVAGELAADNSFTVSHTVSGDLIGDGTFCTATQSISYQPIDANNVNTLFQRDFSCDDGFTCQSRAVGTSTRR